MRGTIWSCPRRVVVANCSPGYKYVAVKRARAGSQIYGHTSMPFALTYSKPSSFTPVTMVNSEPRGMVTATVSSPSSSFPLFFSKGTYKCSTVAVRGQASERFAAVSGYATCCGSPRWEKRKYQHVIFSSFETRQAGPSVVPDMHTPAWKETCGPFVSLFAVVNAPNGNIFLSRAA